MSERRSRPTHASAVHDVDRSEPGRARYRRARPETHDSSGQGEGLPPGAVRPVPGQLTDLSADIEASGLFSVICVRQYDWERVYDAEGYIELLDTFSGHIAMAPWQRERLYGEIRRRLAGRPSGTLRRHWGAALHVARRR